MGKNSKDSLCEYAWRESVTEAEFQQAYEIAMKIPEAVNHLVFRTQGRVLQIVALMKKVRDFLRDDGCCDDVGEVLDFVREMEKVKIPVVAKELFLQIIQEKKAGFIYFTFYPHQGFPQLAGEFVTKRIMVSPQIKSLPPSKIFRELLRALVQIPGDLLQCQMKVEFIEQ